MATATRQPDLATYLDAVRAAGLDAPWSRTGPLIRPKTSRVEPCLWRWSDIEPLMVQSAALVTTDMGESAERRLLRLRNPGVPELTSTHTLSCAIQLLAPGETAPIHRHTPNAFRFMLKGRGAYTIVEGVKYDMAPGDVVLTPSMTWHEHGNEGQEMVMWLDGLDSPVVRFLEILAMQHAAGSAFPDVGPDFRSGRTIHYRWSEMHAALLDRAASTEAPSAFDDVMIDYVEPKDGRPLLPTIGCHLQLLRPGVKTREHRHTSCAVYHVVEGAGTTVIDGVSYEWEKGDFFALPPALPHAHAVRGPDAAVLFSLDDAPLLRALGQYHEG